MAIMRPAMRSRATAAHHPAVHRRRQARACRCRCGASEPIVMVRMMPALNRVKVKYFGDQERIGERQSELNSRVPLPPAAVARPAGGAGRDPVRPGQTSSTPSPTGRRGHRVPAWCGPRTAAPLAMPVAAALSAVAMGPASNAINPLQRAVLRAEKNSTNGACPSRCRCSPASTSRAAWRSTGCAPTCCPSRSRPWCNPIISPDRYVDYETSRPPRPSLTSSTASARRRGRGALTCSPAASAPRPPLLLGRASTSWST